MQPGMISIENIAWNMAHSTRFDDEPVILWEETKSKYGLEHASVIWMRACQIYDEVHANDNDPYS